MSLRIFINYRPRRRESRRCPARDRLAATYSDRNVFMDVDNLRPGQRFDRELERALDKTDVFLAVIGSRWLDIFKDRLAKGWPDLMESIESDWMNRSKTPTQSHHNAEGWRRGRPPISIIKLLKRKIFIHSFSGKSTT